MSDSSRTARGGDTAQKAPPEAAGEARAMFAIPPRRDRRVARLSFAQERLWFLDELVPDNAFYNIPSAMRLSGPLDEEALEKSIGEALRRHESLRTTFDSQDGRPVQVIHAAQPYRLPVDDLTRLPKEARESEAMRLVSEEFKRPFNLKTGPLLRAGLLRLGEQDHILMLVMHHIVSDGWSMRIILEELSLLYHAFSTGADSPLTEPIVQYADYAEWQRDLLRAEVLDKQIAYWKRQLEGAPPALELPTDRARPALQTYNGARQSIDLPPPLIEAAQALSRSEGATLFMTVLAAFNILLRRYSGQEDISVGTLIAGRNRRELEEVVGLFVNTLVLRADLSGDPSCRELIRRVKKLTLEAYAHQDVPFEKLVESLQPARDLSRSPLFQVLFTLQSEMAQASGSEGVRMEPLKVDIPTAKFDISVGLMNTGWGFSAVFEYNTDLFDAETITRMQRHFKRLLEAMVANPEQRISALAMLTDEEQWQLLSEWNDTRVDYPAGVSIQQLFERQAEMTPGSVALVYEGQQVSYAELNARANKLAHRLKSLGVGAQKLAGVCLNRSIEMVVALLGVLKAGGAYLPLDPGYPKERLSAIIEDSGASVLLTVEELMARLPDHRAQVLRLDADREAIEQCSSANPAHEVSGENIAYVIYTSGSTGKPKGVAITHRGIANYLSWCIKEYAVADGIGAPVHSPLTFDLTVTSLFPALLTGRSIFLVSESNEVEKLIGLLRSIGNFSLVKITPAHLYMVNQLLSAEEAAGRTLSLIIGGEALSAEMLAFWRRNAPETRLINEYGPTETAVGCCTYEVGAGDPVTGPVPIGRPIANTQIYILDSSLQPVPVGVPGELCVGGDCLGHGYLNQPALTAEKFVPNPFSRQAGARIYKTGDLARFRSDGCIEFLGRIDHQVKIRGYRVELQEIESALSLCPGIREAVAAVIEASPSDKRLIAYVTASEGQDVTPEQVRAFAKSKLPGYMVPSAVMVMEELPLTPNGKVDRNALPAPDRARQKLTQEYAAPRTPLEQALAELWAALLQVDRVGANDNFFELGGHSLLATQIISRVRTRFGVDLPLRVVFQSPTVSGMAAAILSASANPHRVESIAQAMSSDQASSSLAGAPHIHDDSLNLSKLALDLSPSKQALLDMLLKQEGLDMPLSDNIPRRAEFSPVPMSFAQERLWFLDRLMPGNPFYNMPIAVRLGGRVSIRALEQSINEIVRRHESLRTSFAIVEGQPMQVIAPALRISLPVVDLSMLSQEEREAEAQRIAAVEAHQAFDLAKGPLLKAVLLRLSDEDHVMLFTMHHIISDAWSLEVLVKEVTALYDAFSTGKEPELPELEIQYADYAVWQREWLSGQFLQEQLSYWKHQLADMPAALNLPTDKPRPPVQSFQGATLSAALPEQVSEPLRSLSRQESASMFMVLLAAFDVLLMRYSNQSDIVVGTPIAGRTRAELEPLIGFFVNTLAMRVRVEGSIRFREVVRRVREAALGAYGHQEVPFEKLVEEMQPERSLSHTPLFQVVFNFLNAPKQELGLNDVELSGVRSEIQSAKFDLTFVITDLGQELALAVHYSTDLFDDATIRRMIGHFQTLIEAIAANPDQPISKLPLMSAGERRELLARRAARRYDATGPIHRRFEAQVKEHPSTIALVYEQERLTYEQLNRRSNHLAHRLRRLGVGPESLVAICLERSIEMVVAILGALKAGAAYVPLDPQYPRDRLAFILDDARPSVLLTSERLAELLPDHQAQLVCMDADRASMSEESEEDLDIEIAPENAAYMIYTSGSTGKPKGVLVSHANVARLFDATDHWYGFDERDVWTLFHSYAFDFSVWELWGALSYGGRLVVVPHWVARSPESFYDLLISERVTALNQTPSAFRQLAQVDERAGADKQLSLRYVIFGGEALELQGLKGWIERHGDNQPVLVNMYGITETTVHVTYRVITKADVEQATGSVIGAPIDDLEIYLLDEHMEPVPVGVAGEIHVGGDGLARGYHNRHDLTAERFVPDPFSRRPGTRLYRSGDLAKYTSRGELEYLGRIDAQVKVRGYRIELGEIEAALLAHPLVREAAVVAREGGEEKRLVAYVVAAQRGELSASELRQLLSDKLPEYMMPASFVMLDRLPLTPNGKVNRRALPDPEPLRPELSEEYVAPRDELEQFLADKWQKVLNLERVGVNDDFFELGGDSIKAAILVNRLQEELGEVIHVVVIFDAPTIAGLAAYLNEKYRDAVERRRLSRQTDERPLASGRARKVDAAMVAEMRRLIAPLPPREARAADRSKNRRAIFVLAPPRSGTTLLRVMLGGHPLLFAPPELELLSFNTLDERRAAFTGRDSFWLEGNIRTVMQIKGCDAETAKAIVEDYEKQKLTTKQFYRLIQEWLGERILVDKTPSYALDLETLRRAEADFDNAFYIHLLRSPQGMIRSYEEARLHQIFPRFKHPFPARQLAELVWVISQQNILSLLSEVPQQRQYRVKFESLVKEPETVLRGLCRALGIDFHPAMIEPYEDKSARMTDGIHEASHMLGDIKFHQHKGIDSSVAESWKGYFTDDFLGEITREVAESLGYGKQELELRSGESIRPLSSIQVQAAASEAEQALAALDRLSDDEVDSLLSEMLGEAQDSQ